MYTLPEGLVSLYTIPMHARQVLLCISTLLESSNRELARRSLILAKADPTVSLGHADYSRMFTLKTPTGQPLFETFQVSLICGALLDHSPNTPATLLTASDLRADKCLASDHPERCTHRAAEVPRWISNAKMETIKTLLVRPSPPSARRTLTLVARLQADDPALLMRESVCLAEARTRMQN